VRDAHYTAGPTSGSHLASLTSSEITKKHSRPICATTPLCLSLSTTLCLSEVSLSLRRAPSDAVHCEASPDIIIFVALGAACPPRLEDVEVQKIPHESYLRVPTMLLPSSA
jgi:hypothetical protein